MAIVVLTLLFILLSSRKWAGERTTYQTLPVVGLILILISGICDIIINNKPLQLTTAKNSDLRLGLLSVCRILLQNQIFVLVWLSSHYIQLEILIAAPKLLKQPQYAGMSIEKKRSVIKAKERVWVYFGFTVCCIYYALRVFCIILMGVNCKNDESPSLCRQNSPNYTVIILSNLSINFFIVMMFLKSSYMIKCSIEDQRGS